MCLYLHEHKHLLVRERKKIKFCFIKILKYTFNPFSYSAHACGTRLHVIVSSNLTECPLYKIFLSL